MDNIKCKGASEMTKERKEKTYGLDFQKSFIVDTNK